MVTFPVMVAGIPYGREAVFVGNVPNAGTLVKKHLYLFPSGRRIVQRGWYSGESGRDFVSACLPQKIICGEVG